jgi:hypothetical protein
MDIRARAEELLGRPIARLEVFTDTSQFMALEPGQILDLGGVLFVLKGVEYEGRFGLDDEPKHWVKRGIDMASGEPKIIKLVFHEEFDLPVGPIKVRCYRSPAKESRILELVRGMPQFMQGYTIIDSVGNQVRVLERIQGHALNKDLDALKIGHQDYYQTMLKGFLVRLVEAFEAIAFLHAHQERHGDIRRDHLFVERGTGQWRWIDFDYNFEFHESPYGLDLFGLGNVLCYVVGRGIPTLHELKKSRPELLERLDTGDLSLVIPSRVFNLRKVYPYIPEKLNRVLMHFAAAAEVFYENVGEILADLLPALDELPG